MAKLDVSNITPTCPHCLSEYVFGMSRVVGYFSIIENWNHSKIAELKRRQKGNYWHDIPEGEIFGKKETKTKQANR